MNTWLNFPLVFELTAGGAAILLIIWGLFGRKTSGETHARWVLFTFFFMGACLFLLIMGQYRYGAWTTRAFKEVQSPDKEHKIVFYVYHNSGDSVREVYERYNLFFMKETGKFAPPAGRPDKPFDFQIEWKDDSFVFRYRTKEDEAIWNEVNYSR